MYIKLSALQKILPNFFTLKNNSGTMKLHVFVCLMICSINAVPLEQRSHVAPDYLDLLLKQKRHDEFEKHMRISVPGLSILNEAEPGVDPSMNVDLFEGDILLTPEQLEQSRQGINFGKYPGSRWPNNDGEPSNVPYKISDDFSEDDKNTIQTAIGEWNEKVQCVKLIPRRDSDNDYVMVFPGRGCYSMLGRRGGEQPLSLGNGCVIPGITWHEFEHAIGFSHEHNRSDRDDYVEVLWQNIPRRWRSQYRKNDPETFGLQANYDYYSVMHYPRNAPGTRRPAFRFKQNIDEGRVGQRGEMTDLDLQKIKELYCPSSK